jgi:hopanoid biosynthesis associated protein HpnK
MDSGKKLIVAADDFGLTHRVNEAIALACRNGIVTSASLLVTAAGFESAVQIARNEPNLDLGLHINFTEGFPVASPAKIPTLAGPNGFHYKHPVKLAAAIFRGKVQLADLELELRAQIEKALASELWLSHFDGHKHVHVLPAVYRIIRKLAQEYGIHAIRAPHERVPRVVSLFTRNKGSRVQIVTQCVFGRLISAASFVSRVGKTQPGLFSPKYFYGIAQTGFLDLESFADIINDLGSGMHELMCHPGYVDDDLAKTPTRLRAQRERELELLTGSEVRGLLKQAGISLISFRDLVESYGDRGSNQVLHRYSAL